MKKVLTLAFFVDGNQILLGYKKRGFGAERWNGFGGKVESDESIESAAKREALEECGVEILKLEKKAIHEFSFKDKLGVLEVHTFWVSEWRGEPCETEEMRPSWFVLEDIPYDTMWPDDELWLPRFLKGEYLKTKFLFGDNDRVLEYEVQTVSKEEIL